MCLLEQNFKVFFYYSLRDGTFIVPLESRKWPLNAGCVCNRQSAALKVDGDCYIKNAQIGT